MPTTRKTILTALHARLLLLAGIVLCDDVLPERSPTAGLIILRDGQPGEPEVTLSPLRYHYQHRAELEVVVQVGTGRAAASHCDLVDLLAHVGIDGRYVDVPDSHHSSQRNGQNTGQRDDSRNQGQRDNRPTRRREKVMGRFRSQGQAQHFLALHEHINTIFKPRRYRLTAASYRHARADAFGIGANDALQMTA